VAISKPSDWLQTECEYIFQLAHNQKSSI
jgi:hypothetical protein